jgi:transposase
MPRRIKLTTNLQVDEVERRYRSAGEGTERSHWHIRWLLAQGHPAYQVAQMTGYSAYWIGRVARRFNEEGAGGLVDHRKAPHGRERRPHPHTLLSTPAELDELEELEELRQALLGRAPQEDVWNIRTVAAWLSARAGRPVSQDAALRSLHLLDFTPQAPRPRHSKAASPEERTAFKNTWKPR